MKHFQGLVAKNAESVYRGGPTRSSMKVKIRRDGRFVLGVVVGLPHPSPASLVGEHVSRRLLYRGTVEVGPWDANGSGVAPARARTQHDTFHDFGLSRGVTWLEPTLHVELTYSEVMEGRLRDPVYRTALVKAESTLAAR